MSDTYILLKNTPKTKAGAKFQLTKYSNILFESSDSDEMFSGEHIVNTEWFKKEEPDDPVITYEERLKSLAKDYDSLIKQFRQLMETINKALK